MVMEPFTGGSLMYPKNTPRNSVVTITACSVDSLFIISPFHWPSSNLPCGPGLDTRLSGLRASPVTASRLYGMDTVLLACPSTPRARYAVNQKTKRLAPGIRLARILKPLATTAALSTLLWQCTHIHWTSNGKSYPRILHGSLPSMIFHARVLM